MGKEIARFLSLWIDNVVVLTIGAVIGFIGCASLVSDYVQIYDIDGVKTVHQKGHFYRLIEVDRKGGDHD